MEKQINKLRNEAISNLHYLFELENKLDNNDLITRTVDCIIYASILTVADLQKTAVKEVKGENY